VFPASEYRHQMGESFFFDIGPRKAHFALCGVPMGCAWLLPWVVGILGNIGDSPCKLGDSAYIQF